jgi:Uma2 family endonuclease
MPNFMQKSHGPLQVVGLGTNRISTVSPYPAAPELCIEVISPSNAPAEMTEKIHLYLGYGAREVWTVSDAGDIRIHGPEGERPISCFNNVGRPAL